MSLTTPLVRLRVLPALLPLAGRDLEIQVSGGVIQQRAIGRPGDLEQPWRDVITVEDLLSGAGLVGDMLRSENLAGLADNSAALSNLGFSTFMKALVDDPSAAAARTTLGVVDTYISYALAQALSDAQKVQARSNIGSAWEMIANQSGFTGQSQIVVSIPTGVRAIRTLGTLIPSAVAQIYAQLSTNGGASWISAGYVTQIENITGTASGALVASQSALLLSSTNASIANSPTSFGLNVDSLTNPGRPARFRISASFFSNTASEEMESFVSGRITGVTGTVNAIRFFAQSGTLSGDLLVEGIR